MPQRLWRCLASLRVIYVVCGVSDLLPLLEAIGLLHTGVVLAQTHIMHGGPQGAQQLDTQRQRHTRRVR